MSIYNISINYFTEKGEKSRLTDGDTDKVDSAEYVQGVLADRAENVRERQGQGSD